MSITNTSFEIFESAFLAVAEMEPLSKLCARDPILHLIRRHFAQGARLLEAGAGDGHWVVYLNSIGYDIVGLELSSGLCQKFNAAYPTLQMYQGDIRRMPFNDCSFDGIISLGAVEHVPEGPEGCIMEIARVLRPDGKALLTVPNIGLFQSIFHRLRDGAYWLRFPQLRPHMRALRWSTRKDLYCFRFPSKVDKQVNFFEYRMRPGQLASIARSCGLRVAEASTLYPEAGIFNTLGSLGAHWSVGQEVQLTAVGKTVRRLAPETWYNHMAFVVCRRPRSLKD